MQFLGLPSVGTRTVGFEAVRVHRVLTYLALDNVLLLVNVVQAPWALIVVNERAWPFVAVRLVMSGMKPAVAVSAALCDDLGHLPVTERAED